MRNNIFVDYCLLSRRVVTAGDILVLALALREGNTQKTQESCRMLQPRWNSAWHGGRTGEAIHRRFFFTSSLKKKGTKEVESSRQGKSGKENGCNRGTWKGREIENEESRQITVVSGVLESRRCDDRQRAE